MPRGWAVVLGCFTAVLVAGGLAPGSASAVDAPARTAVARGAIASATVSTSPTRFATLPPGSALRSDAACARALAPARETNPENANYNRVAGARRLPVSFFPEGSGNPAAATKITARVTGAYSGTTPQILRWVSCKWGIDERIVAAQVALESSRRQAMRGDWTANAAHCAPGHGLGVDGRTGQCPESFGILQVRYRYFSGAFPDAVRSTAFNADTVYAVWRACYEGYEWWLQDAAAPGHRYHAGDGWGCIGRWYSGQWYGPSAERYIACAKNIVYGRKPCS